MFAKMCVADLNLGEDIKHFISETFWFWNFYWFLLRKIDYSYVQVFIVIKFDRKPVYIFFSFIIYTFDYIIIISFLKVIITRLLLFKILAHFLDKKLQYFIN